MDRRDFIRNGARSLLLAGLAAMSGALIYRNYTKEEDCSFNFLCQDCNSLSKCRLPEGMNYKKQSSKR